MSKKKEFAPKGMDGVLEVHEVNDLIGKLLTILDASIPESSQKVSLKQLVKNTIWDWASKPHLVIEKGDLEILSKEAEPVENIDGSIYDPRIS